MAAEEVERPTDTDMDTDVVGCSTRRSGRSRGGRKRKPPSWQVGYDIESPSLSSSSAAAAAAPIKGLWTCHDCGKDTFQSKAGYVTHAKFCSRSRSGRYSASLSIINKTYCSNTNVVDAETEQALEHGGLAASPQQNPSNSTQTAVERSNDDNGGSTGNSMDGNNANSLMLACQTCGKNDFKSKGGYATHVKFCGSKGGGASAGRRKSTNPAGVGTGTTGNGHGHTRISAATKKIQKSSSIKPSSGKSDSDTSWPCENCGKLFKLKSGYVIHSKFCGNPDSSRVGGNGTNNCGGSKNENRPKWDDTTTSCPNCGRDSFKSSSGYALHVKFCDGGKKRRRRNHNSEGASFDRLSHESIFSSELDFQTEAFFDDNHFAGAHPMTAKTDNENIDDLWEKPLMPPGNAVEDDHEWLFGEFCQPVVTPNDKDIESVSSQRSNSAIATQPYSSLLTSSSTSKVSLPDIRFNGRRDLHESITPANAKARPCVYCDYKHHKAASDSASAFSNTYGAKKPPPTTSKVSYVKDRCMVCVLPICKDHFDIFHDPNIFHPPVAVSKTLRKVTATNEASILSAGVTPFRISDGPNISSQVAAELGMDDTGFSPIPVFNTTRHTSGNGGVVPTFSWSDDQLPTDFILEDTPQPSHGILGSDDFAVLSFLTTGATNQTNI